jgi:hypothetical protein
MWLPELEAELQVIHDLNRTTYEPQQTVLSNNEPTVNHTLDVEPGPNSSNSTLPTQEQPTTTNIDTGAPSIFWVCSDVVNDVFIVIEEQVPVFAIHHDFCCCVIHH